MKDRQTGFSLIELTHGRRHHFDHCGHRDSQLSSRKDYRERNPSAVSAVDAVNTAEIAYSTMFTSIGYSAALSDLGTGGTSPCPSTPTASCFIDPALASGTKSGYIFTYVQNASTTPAVQFTLNAAPQVQDITGQKSFYSDESNVIRYNSTGAANSGSPPL